MRNLLAAALLLLAPVAMAQQVPEGAHWGVPFVNCNTIVVTMPDTPTVRQIGDLLLDNNHTVGATNAEFGTIASGEDMWGKKRGMAHMVINARIKGRAVEWSGELGSRAVLAVRGTGGGGEQHLRAFYSADAYGLAREAFNHINAVARKMGGIVHYEKR